MPKKPTRIGVIVEEFFHRELRGFGGFGKGTQYLSDHFNRDGSPYRLSVLLAQGLPLARRPEIRSFHNAKVLVRPPERRALTPMDRWAWHRLIRRLGIEVFLTVDFLPSYRHYLLAAPHVPTAIWFRDPRGRSEWETMAAVPLELEWRRCRSREELTHRGDDAALALHSLLDRSRNTGRGIVLAANGESLAERARRAYGLPQEEIQQLPNPVPIPPNPTPPEPRPTLAFIGRLDPVKRPWIALELARRLPEVRFLVLGDSNFPQRMEERLYPYRALSNVRFMGFLDGEEKERALSSAWGLINTSAHEGIPMTFLESFARERPVISCVDPDGLVSRFGYFAGQVAGEGTDEHALQRFQIQIRRLLSDGEERSRKGKEARTHVAEHFSFDAFSRAFDRLTERLQIA